MQEKSDQPQQEPIGRERKSEHVLAPTPPEQPPGDVSGQVIFDRLTAMQEQLQQIDQKLQMHIDLVRELREVRDDRDLLRREVDVECDRQAQEREQQLHEADAERAGQLWDAATVRERQVQDEEAKRERRRQQNAEAKQRYRRSRGAQGREEHAAYMRQWRFRRSQQ